MTEPPICLVVRRFTIGGLERVVSLLANGLVTRGRTVRVVVLESTALSALITELHQRVEVHVLTGSRAARLARLRELTAGHVVHLHFADGLVHPAVRWALRANDKMFVTYHSDYTPVRNGLRNRLDRWITSRGRGAIAVSEAVRRFCLDEVGLPGHLVHVIENAVPAPAASPVRIAGTGFTLIALATVNPHKNYPGLLRGVALLRDRGHDVRLRIVGDGPALAEAFTEAGRLNLAECVDWYGALWQSSIVDALLASSDVFVSASRNEGLPMSVLEGLQHGLPMVLSDIPPHREAAGGAARYFDPDDPEGFADQVEQMRTDSVRREHAEQAGKQAQRFSVDEFVTRHLDLYTTASGPR